MRSHVPCSNGTDLKQSYYQLTKKKGFPSITNDIRSLQRRKKKVPREKPLECFYGSPFGPVSIHGLVLSGCNNFKNQHPRICTSDSEAQEGCMFVWVMSRLTRKLWGTEWLQSQATAAQQDLLSHCATGTTTQHCCAALFFHTCL